MNSDNGNYLAVLLKESIQDYTLCEEDIVKIKNNLWLLLGRQIERYTMGDSSSVPVEIAEELLKSICFTIGLGLKATNGSFDLLKSEDLDDLLKMGWKAIEAMITNAKDLLQCVASSRPQIENISYNDTLKEISSSFKKYDYRFFAHDVPCGIDYQLSQPVSEELQGIEYVNEYLRRLVIENNFCTFFDTEAAIGLLNSYCPDYKGLLINIFEPVAVNAMGLAIINKDISLLDISNTDREQLLHEFENLSQPEAVNKISLAVEKLSHQMQINDIYAKEYLLQVLLAQLPRIEMAVSLKKLDGIFLPLYKESNHTNSSIHFTDGEMLDNKELQKLIEEINRCRFVTDKIKMVKQEIHSLRDIIEVLNVCFWGNECIQLFSELSRTELALLSVFIEGQPQEWESATKWEKQLQNHF